LLLKKYSMKCVKFYNTFESQFEVLPRLTIIYGKGRAIEMTHNGFAIEWLWFGIFVNV
jgi:hypothetical protein